MELSMDLYPVKFQGEEFPLGELIHINDYDYNDKDRKPDVMMAPLKYFMNRTLMGNDMQFIQPLPSDCLDVSHTSTFTQDWFDPYNDPHGAVKRRETYLGVLEATESNTMDARMGYYLDWPNHEAHNEAGYSKPSFAPAQLSPFNRSQLFMFAPMWQLKSCLRDLVVKVPEEAPETYVPITGRTAEIEDLPPAVVAYFPTNNSVDVHLLDFKFEWHFNKHILLSKKSALGGFGDTSDSDELGSKEVTGYAYK